MMVKILNSKQLQWYYSGFLHSWLVRGGGFPGKSVLGSLFNDFMSIFILVLKLLLVLDCGFSKADPEMWIHIQIIY